MEQAIAKRAPDGSSTGNINGDGVYNTRYVFINYGERRYSPYISTEIKAQWHQTANDEKGNAVEKFTANCPILWVYKIQGSIQTIDDMDPKLTPQRPYGKYVQVNPETDFYNSNQRYYLLKDSITQDPLNNLTPDGIDENCEYSINKEIDKKHYQANYDHTVWQKIWCSVSSNTTITEKYIMVASLDSKAPKFEAIVDAPDDNDEYEKVSFLYEDNSRVQLSPLNSYYQLDGETIIGEGETALIIPKYKELDISYIVDKWNASTPNVKKLEESVKENLEEIIDYEEKINNSEEYKGLFTFDTNHEANADKIGGYSEYRANLVREKALAQYAGDEVSEQYYNTKITNLDDMLSQYASKVQAWKQAIANLKEARKKEYEALPIKDIYRGPLFEYKKITSDIIIYEPLEKDVNGKKLEIITSQEILDMYLETLGNIYYSSDYIVNNPPHYVSLSVGSKYSITDNNGITLKYYHKKLEEPGYISFELFKRLVKIPQQLYYFDNNKLIEATIDEYIITDDAGNISYNEKKYNQQRRQYAQRVRVHHNHGPHIDTFRSTDLDYKLHLPRNWKFNTNTDFHYNIEGFNKRRQHYIPDRVNEIYLKKTSSGELYPVHMDTKGYKLINNKLNEGTLSNIKEPFSLQLSDSGFYVNNELKYAKQIDQRTFDINLPELGNMASLMWDLVYPRGTWVIYNPQDYGETNTYVDYSDKKYLNGELYYPDPNGTYIKIELKDQQAFDEIDEILYIKKDNKYIPNQTNFNSNQTYYIMDPEQYIQVGKGDQLYRQAYCIFIPADKDTIDKKRYLFIGNDRDPNNSALYPKTISELIRYLYKLLGLETDNDYYDMPSQETIWGMYNALLNLLGKYTDSYSINNFIPVKSEYVWADLYDQNGNPIVDSNGNILKDEPAKEVVYYGKRGEVDFGLRNPNNQWDIKTKETFSTLHTGAFGPLYVVQDNYPIWKKVEDLTVKPSPDTAYYIENDNGDKVYAGDITKFNDKKTYYTAYLLYEKASGLKEGVQYYRDINSLWGLLREFQQCRDKYQANWTQDHPGSPSYIQNRPSVIYSTEKAVEIEYNKEDFYGDNNYVLETSVKDTATLKSVFNSLTSNQKLMVYYLDETESPQYVVVQVNDEYIPNAEYYKLDKSGYLLDTHNVDGLWKKILINPSDKENYYEDGEQVINISYYTMDEILSIFQE